MNWFRVARAGLLLFAVTALFFFAIPCRAESISVSFHLANGTVVSAQLLRFENGYFVVQWKNKIIKAPEQVIASIRFHSKPKTTSRLAEKNGQRPSSPRQPLGDGTRQPSVPPRRRPMGTPPFKLDLNTRLGRRMANFIKVWDAELSKPASEIDLDILVQRTKALEKILLDDPRAAWFVESQLRRRVDLLLKRADTPAYHLGRFQALLACVLAWEGDVKDAQWIANEAKGQAPEDAAVKKLCAFAEDAIKNPPPNPSPKPARPRQPFPRRPRWNKSSPPRP